jgi:uncharacterized protein involved in outer membrane biogenesis
VITATRQRLRRIARRVGWSTLALIATPIVVAFVWLRFFGLPDSTKNYLLREIQQRHVLPYPISIDRLLLSPTGALLADKVTVYGDSTRTTTRLYVDQVRIGIAWLSWWRGRGIVKSASISNAEVRLPIGPDETAEFTGVNADFAFDGHDIRIDNAQARFLNLELAVRGVIHNEGFPPAKPPTAQQTKAREDIFRSVKKALADVASPQPIDVELEFETTTRDLVGGRANFSIEGENLTWRGAPIDEFGIHGTLGDGVVNLNDFKVDLNRGELSAYGHWNLGDHSAELQFTSSMDFTTLAPAFPGALGNAMKRLDFPQDAPSMTGRVLFDLGAGFHADVQADLDWRNFTFNGVNFAQLTIPLAYDGKRLLIPGLKIAGNAGNVDLQFFFDRTQDPPHLTGKITSTLDPTILKGVFGEKMDQFLASCAFPAGGPHIVADATGTALKTDAWTVKGNLNATRFTYKNATFDSATSDFTFADSRLDLSTLEVHRPEGGGTGRIVYDFKNRTVELHNLVSQLDVSQVAPIMGPKFTEYTKPYHFDKPPLVHANGLVDLQDKKVNLDTDLLVEIDGRSNMNWTLFHIPYVFNEPDGTLDFKNRRMTVNMKKCGFYGGGLTGVLDLDLRETPADYVVDLKLDKVDFQRFMVRSFNYVKSTGVMDAHGHFAGALGSISSMNGQGDASVDDGDITGIPLLGSLTPLIPGISAADAAHGTFTITNGIIRTDDLNITSETLALIGDGNYNFITDKLDLNMRVNTRVPLFGILAYPVSKIFEFHASGTMKNPQWAARNF